MNNPANTLPQEGQITYGVDLTYDTAGRLHHATKLLKDGINGVLTRAIEEGLKNGVGSVPAPENFQFSLDDAQSARIQHLMQRTGLTYEWVVGNILHALDQHLTQIDLRADGLSSHRTQSTSHYEVALTEEMGDALEERAEKLRIPINSLVERFVRDLPLPSEAEDATKS